MVVINFKNKYALILLIFLSGLNVSLCAKYSSAPECFDLSIPSFDLSGVIEDVCLNVTKTNNLAYDLKQSGATQTLAYLGHTGLHNQISNAFSSKIYDIGLDYFKDLLKSVIQKEIKFKDDYYVFYHGQPLDFALPQDLYQGLYGIIYKKAMNDFVMLRISSEDQFNFESIFDFLKYYIKIDEIFNAYDFDLQSHIKKLLLSVNPSLFGNTSGPGCSSLEYFLASRGCTFVDTSELVERTFDFFYLNNLFYKYLPEMKELHKLLSFNEKEKTGLLQQIFIPKAIVDSIAYRSWPLGSLYYHDRYPEKHLASIDLNNYKNNKAIADFDFDGTQFRLLMTGPMLDPESGVKIFRYCNETPKFKEYKIKLKKLLNKIAQECF